MKPLKLHAKLILLSLLTGLYQFIPLPAEAAPAAPTALQSPPSSTDDSSTLLVWQKPAQNLDIIKYNIYQNGRLIGSTDDMKYTTKATQNITSFTAAPANKHTAKIAIHNYLASNLQPSVSYNFTVRAVAADGSESSDSNILQLTTMPRPTRLSITSYGARADTNTVNTSAIQQAIDKCPSGGTVVVPPGTFITGPLYLHSNMTFNIERGAKLLAVADAASYKMLGDNYEGIINITESNAQNIRLTGEGTLDGNGWIEESPGIWPFASASKDNVAVMGRLAKIQTDELMKGGMNFANAYLHRSNMLRIIGVTNFYASGLTVQNPANHTFVTSGSNNVTLNNIKVHTYNCNNGDGIDNSSNNLIVVNSYFDTGDDMVNFSAGMGAVGEQQPPVSNAWIFNNYFSRGHGAVVIGSHTASWIENILAEDNVIENTRIGLRCKTRKAIGGGGRNIIFRDNALKNILRQAVVITSDYTDSQSSVRKYQPAKTPGYFHDITIENCTIDGVEREPILIEALSGWPHQNINFKNIHFFNTATQPVIGSLKNSSFENIFFDGRLTSLKG